jgi:hypothetical protein
MPWVATMSTFRDIIEKTEQYAVDIINGRQETVWDRLFRVFLFLLSRLYRNVTQLRLTLYNKSILKQHELGCTVISVGNLTTGGTGKTPVVELLAGDIGLERSKCSDIVPWLSQQAETLLAAFAWSIVEEKACVPAENRI